VKKAICILFLTYITAGEKTFSLIYQTTYEGNVPPISSTYITDPENPLGIVGAQKLDSLGTEDWKNYLQPEKLLRTWQQNGLLGKYQKLKLLQSIETYKDDILPRYSEGEENSVRGIRNLIQKGIIDNHTMVILDSGGAHSVAMAMELVRELNATPILMFDCDPMWPLGANKHAIQILATLLYFSAEFQMLKSDGQLHGPPVFVLDTHRDSLPLPGELDNSYKISPPDLPTPQELLDMEIRKVVIITEGTSRDWLCYAQAVDLGKRLFDYSEAGLKILRFGIPPWPQSQHFLPPFPFGSSGK
jgi:hypothetical protein